MSPEELELLQKVAMYYARGGYKLDEEVTDTEIEKVAKLTKDSKIEVMFNELLASYMAIKKKRNKN